MWLHSSGTLGGIARTIAQGVPKPKESSLPMPPMGGAQLTVPQLQAVAAYVYALGHPLPGAAPATSSDKSDRAAPRPTGGG